MDESMKIKRAFGVVAVVGILLAPVVLEKYRPEIFMSENQALSKDFSIAYMGSSFDVLRLSCWGRSNVNGYYQEWSIDYHRGDTSVRVKSHRKGDPCPVYNVSLVIKKNGSNPGYSVMTTGQEKESSYSPDLVKRLLFAVDTGNAEVQRQKTIKSSWDTNDDKSER